MAFEETNDPNAPATDTSAWGVSTTTGEKLILDSVVASPSNLSVTLSNTVESLFEKLSSDGVVGNSTYLRGLQLLYSFGLDTLVTPYWSDRGASLVDIEEEILGSVSATELAKSSPEFSIIKQRLRSILASTTVDSKLLDMARAEASGFGEISEVLEAVLLYFIVLGEANLGRVNV